MTLTAAPHDDKKRLDHYLAEHFDDISRSFLQSLCKHDKVTVNGSPQKSGYRLHWGDTVEVLHDLHSNPKPANIDIPVLYEDENIIAVNKPSGVLSHALSKFKDEPSVASFLRQHSKKTTENIRYGIVHRLDRLTSGVMICAKNDSAVKQLQRQFANRTVEKEYIAVVSHEPKLSEATIDIPIERNPKKPATFRPGKNGKPAQTFYKVTTAAANGCLLSVKPRTGRTHQIRVHLQHIGCPIIGDSLYGGEDANRLYLHARSIQLYIPGVAEPKTISAPVPKAFKQIISGNSKNE